MKLPIYECDSDGLFHEEESEDVMDLDSTEVLNFMDVNHEIVGDRRHEGRGFYEALEKELDNPQDDDLTDEELDILVNSALYGDADASG